MIITCPNCQTRYNVAPKAIGSAGRKVACANCHQSWLATPEPPQPAAPPPPKPKTADYDKPVTAREEDALDAGFEAAAPEQVRAGMDEQVAAFDGDDDQDAMGEQTDIDPDKPKLDAPILKKHRAAMQGRVAAIARNAPMARIRARLRFVLFTLFLTSLMGGFWFREPIVNAFPDLAGIYEAVGLRVNVVGLEFEGVSTLRTMRDGVEMMIVTGTIRNVTRAQRAVPQMIVSVLDMDGKSIYSWSVVPVAKFIGPGEALDFETQLNQFPTGAERVKLSFASEKSS